jgi:hypothetical protein
LIDTIMGLFNPYNSVARELQAAFRLERPPACRVQHGRLEIVVRGAAMTSAPVEQRVALARQFTAMARPLLRAHSKRDRRRYASRAIAVIFEDETIVGDGIATSRFTFLASHDSD